MRFGLRHLFAFTTLFAIGASSGVLLRDGTWEVVSIEEEGIGCWIGEDPDTGEPVGGSLFAFFATLRDGDRVRKVEIGGDRLWSSTPLPEVGDLIQFTDAPTNMAGASIGYACPTWEAVEDEHHAWMLLFNTVVLTLACTAIVFAFTLLKKFATWLLEVMERRFQDRQELANALRFNRIV